MRDTRASTSDDTVQLSIDDDPGAAAEARRTTRHVLARWRLPALVDSVVLAVSELVTNAMRHGRPPVWLTLRRRAEDLRVDVHDANPGLVRSGAPGNGAEAESGRGLQIVTALADEVGVEQIPNDGKVVFASFPTEESTTPSEAENG
jgi:anti-sigma regulatory factor (Ser/Thr protein kinase)